MSRIVCPIIYQQAVLAVSNCIPQLSRLLSVSSLRFVQLIRNRACCDVLSLFPVHTDRNLLSYEIRSIQSALGAGDVLCGVVQRMDCSLLHSTSSE